MELVEQLGIELAEGGYKLLVCLNLDFLHCIKLIILFLKIVDSIMACFRVDVCFHSIR